MIRTKDAIETARSYLGTPYAQMDCINLIKKVIRTAPGGVPSYTTAGTNTLWNSYDAVPKYRDLTWRQEGIAGARAGMLAFKRSGTDVHHAGIVTDVGTVIHSSSTQGGRGVVETTLTAAEGWNLLGRHRYIEVADGAMEGGEEEMKPYQMQVALSDPTSTLNVRSGPSKSSERIDRLSHGTMVTVQEELASGWKRITYGDHGSGYVDGSFLAPYEEREPETPDTKGITIIDSDGNRFNPVGDFRVLIERIVTAQ